VPVQHHITCIEYTRTSAGNPARKYRWKKLPISEQKAITQNTGRCKMHERFVYSTVLKIRHHFHHHAYRRKYKWNRNQKK